MHPLTVEAAMPRRNGPWWDSADRLHIPVDAILEPRIAAYGPGIGTYGSGTVQDYHIDRSRRRFYPPRAQSNTCCNGWPVAVVIVALIAAVTALWLLGSGAKLSSDAACCKGSPSSGYSSGWEGWRSPRSW